MRLFSFNISGLIRIGLVVVIAGGAHVAVILVRRLGQSISKGPLGTSLSKARSIISLGTSMIVFVIYFTAIGMILKEFGVSLKAYLASASVLGLAIGFGSQGLVQDVVTGLTIIFSDLLDVGDMVEISGQTGAVQRIGMRFTVIRNHLGADVYIPNRSITNVINYPRGYIRCLVDVTLTGDADTASRMEQTATSIMTGAMDQFPGIFIYPPSVEGRIKTSAGKEFLRIKFRIWPGRGAPIESALKQEITQTLKLIDPAYSDWMVTVNFEVEKKAASVSSGRPRSR